VDIQANHKRKALVATSLNFWYRVSTLRENRQMKNIQPINKRSQSTVAEPFSVTQGGRYRQLENRIGKRSFLVFKNNRYISVATDNIAFFYIRYESPVIMCFDKQEYFVNYSLDQIQRLLSDSQFYRLNRQYLVNFNAITEVEHYFARKLLVKLSIVASENLIVSKEKATSFLGWLENR
jgi:DNA-binding LytR/AlgR family response regulator